MIPARATRLRFYKEPIMASENVLEITDENFSDEVLSSDVPVLVDFWAEWCQPCRMLTPTIEAIAEDFAGKVKVGKLNVDDNKEAATKFSITAIPAVLLFVNGEVVQSMPGLRKKDDYVEAIEGALAS